MTLFTEANNFFSGKVLYRNPAPELSSEIYAKAEYLLGFNNFAFGIGIENVSSLNQDPYTDDPENKEQYYFGATNLYNSINRAWTAPYLRLVTIGQKWRVGFNYFKVNSGVSTDLGDRFSVSIVRRSDKDNTFTKINNRFKQYSIEGVVTKVSQKQNAVVVDKGAVDGVKKGMRVDFYLSNFLESNELIASGVVVKTIASKSIISLRKRYSKKRVEDGSLAMIEEF